MITEILLIRHAPLAPGEGLAGRRDPEAPALPPARAAALAALAGAPAQVIASPARRAAATAAQIFPGRRVETDPRLWEQDFGAWEGLAPAALPDLGPMAPADLARHRPPGGESFADLCARLAPALAEAAARGGRVALVGHAGTVRGALALALGDPGAGLAFEVAPASATLLRAAPAGPAGALAWSIAWTNRTA